MKIIFAPILLFMHASALAEPGAVAKQTRLWRAAHEREILTEFVELLSIPNVATEVPNISQNAEKIRDLCNNRGLTTKLLMLEGAPPVIVADLAVADAKRTIAFYAHYDGQPVDRAQWKSDPWKPILLDNAGREIDWRREKLIDPESRLFARSAGDDKAPIMAMLAALDALHDANLKPTVNLRFFFEGEEEAGSPHLIDYLKKFPNAVDVDAWVFCDGPVHQSRRMELVFGARGTVGLDLTVYGPIKGLHDGHYGNWVPNPIVRLTHLLDSMRDESGKILIGGFYNDVLAPTPIEKEALSKIPNVEAALRREFEIGATEGGGASLNELLMQPGLNVRGIESGHVGSQASNTIPTEARVSIDFRLVPNETPESIKAQIERHLEAQGYTIVHQPPDTAIRLTHGKIVKVDWGSGYPPFRTPLDLPFSRELASIMTAAGFEPVCLPTVGGSLPMDLFQGDKDIPVIAFPIANHDDNQHAANENLRLQNLWDGIEIFAAFFTGMDRATR